MNSRFKPRLWLFAMIPVCLGITTIAWQAAGSGKSNNNHQRQDTIPSNHHHKEFGDEGKYDEKDLDKSMLKLDEALRRIDTKMADIDWTKIKEELKSSLDKVSKEMEDHDADMDHVQREIDKAMKSVDIEKIQKETARAMQHVEENLDFNAISEQIQQSIALAKDRLNSDELRKNVASLKKINVDEIKEALENAKSTIDRSKIDLKEELENAKTEIERAKKEIQAYKDLLEGLEKDGLIDIREDYDIQYANGDLYINGKKQPQEVLDKYKGYFNHDNTRIYKKKGRFNIDTD